MMCIQCNKAFKDFEQYYVDYKEQPPTAMYWVDTINGIVTFCSPYCATEWNKTNANLVKYYNGRK